MVTRETLLVQLPEEVPWTYAMNKVEKYNSYGTPAGVNFQKTDGITLRPPDGITLFKSSLLSGRTSVSGALSTVQALTLLSGASSYRGHSSLRLHPGFLGSWASEGARRHTWSHGFFKLGFWGHSPHQHWYPWTYGTSFLCPYALNPDDDRNNRIWSSDPRKKTCKTQPNPW